MVCIAGNTAHAAAPYHGAGAGGAVLAQLLDTAGSSISIDRSGAINAVLETCNASAVAGRGECTNGGRMIPGGAPRRLSGRIWDYDVDGMMAQASSACEERVGALGGGKAE